VIAGGKIFALMSESFPFVSEPMAVAASPAAKLARYVHFTSTM
jgi:hypothetical protein